MKRSLLLIILITTTTGYFSCGQISKSTPDSVQIKDSGLSQNLSSQNPLKNYNEQNVDTKYEYRDDNNTIIIQNSLPKGGLKYTDPHGKEYVYAIFWTTIFNESVSPVEFEINFPSDFSELPSSPGRFYKLFLPADTMSLVKKPLFNYGLIHLESFLDTSIQKSSSLKRTINSKESSSFYVVTLFNQGVDGVIRTGFSKKEQDLLYRINGQEIRVGKLIQRN